MDSVMSFPVESEDDAAIMMMDAMFPKENALPCAKEKLAACKGDGFAAPSQGHFDVAGHVVRAFVGMGEFGVVVGYQVVHKGFQVPSSRRVGIFHQDEAAASMLDEHRHNAGVQPAPPQSLLDFSGDFKRAFAVGT